MISMKTIPVLMRLSEDLLRKMDKEVKKGYYTSRAEFMRDVLREKFLKKKVC